MTTVLFIWQVRKQLQNYLQQNLSQIPELELIFPDDLEKDKILEYAETANVIVGWRPTAEMLSRAADLKLFINPGAGVQHLIPLFRKLDSNIALVNGHGNAYFTAQHGVALLLALTNKIIPHHQWMKQGKWRLGDKEARSLPLRYRRIGLLGYGHVNRNIHRMLEGFCTEFHILKRSWEKPIPNVICYSGDELNNFLKEIDTLICAVPFTTRTEGMLGKTELELLGKESLLVNLSRGKVIDEQALFKALKNGIIHSAAIDVWYDYRPEPDKMNRKFPYHLPFHELENLIFSPHRAASPFDDLHRWDEVIENIKRVCEDRDDYLNKVNLQNEY